MPFAVFRRHQRKMLAILAILAMIAFTMDIAFTRNFQGGVSGGSDPVVVELYGRSVRRSEIDRMKFERGRANLFLDQLFGGGGFQFFGDLSTRSLVDALILQHEADELGLPATPALAKGLARAVDRRDARRRPVRPDLPPIVPRPGHRRPTAEPRWPTRSGSPRSATCSARPPDLRQLLMRQVTVQPLVTPLDVFHAFRDQTERTSTQAVAVPVADYVKGVREPTAAQLQAFYDLYKGRLPNPDDPSPGFTVPRRVRVEFLTLDGSALESRYPVRADGGGTPGGLRAAQGRLHPDPPAPPARRPLRRRPEGDADSPARRRTSPRCPTRRVTSPSTRSG
jgi:peptidyl-prolyl cis-trans isomerase D